jgi:SAM-dependent methyltransferase
MERRLTKGPVTWYILAVAGVDSTHPAYAGQAPYTRGVLMLYDAVIYGFASPVLWRCRKSRFIELYNTHVSSRHLDIGVATGRLLDECSFPEGEPPEITLMDLNRNSLEKAARRLARYAPRTHQANVLEPWGLKPASYDSVAMANLLHCVPGAMSEKVIAFEHARDVLAPGGVLFGMTILGEGVEHTRAARVALAIANRDGSVCTHHDDLGTLDAGLARVFDSHEIQIQGSTALFSARVSP